MKLTVGLLYELMIDGRRRFISLVSMCTVFYLSPVNIIAVRHVTNE